MKNLSGFTLALAGFAFLTCGDALIKSMAGLWPPTAIAALRFSIAIPLLATLAFGNSGKSAFQIRRPWIQAGRGFALAASSAFFFSSLFLLPLAEATAIVFVSPIITALLSALFLRERLGLFAWAGTLLALIGVAIVLRPNLAEAGVAALLPLAAAFFFASLMILNRMASGTGSALALQFILAAVAAPLLIMVSLAGHRSGIAQLQIDWPEWSVIARCSIVAITASVSHYLIYTATTRATAADVAQAVYVQLPVALAIDALVFRHFPDIAAIGGSALIISAGLLIWYNQRRLVKA
ncbi:MAG: DMT family transporter [Sphingorhabdus sp.]